MAKRIVPNPNIFPKPKPIDWTKYIEPLVQDFDTKNKLTIAKYIRK